MSHATSKPIVTAYVKEHDEILEKYGLKDQPQRIFNVDETRFLGEHPPPEVIAPKNIKVNAITSSRGATTTVLVTSSAMCNAFPPWKALQQ